MQQGSRTMGIMDVVVMLDAPSGYQAPLLVLFKAFSLIKINVFYLCFHRLQLPQAMLRLPLVWY